MFDVSHMTVVDLTGAHARANSCATCSPTTSTSSSSAGKALYSCMLDEQGGVIDDLIVYCMDEAFFRVVVNASTRQGSRLDRPPGTGVRHRRARTARTVDDRRAQGPHARAKAAGVLSAATAEKALALGKFAACEGDGLFIARTGYTGEDGFEIVVPEGEAVALWNRLLEAGVAPAGLGARDTLRLEAGMNLYGQDMDETTTPWEAGLAWKVALEAERDFIGRAALEAQKQSGVPRRMVGLVMDEKGVLRHGQRVATPQATARSCPERSRRRSAPRSRSRASRPVPKATCVDIRGRSAGAHRQVSVRPRRQGRPASLPDPVSRDRGNPPRTGCRTHPTMRAADC